jgi:V/A-type H+-transporting ATPase subunit K
MKKIKLTYRVAMATIVLMGVVPIGTAWADHGGASGAAHAATAVHAPLPLSSGGNWAAFLAIAITMGSACLSAGYAVGKVGSAALGAAVEKPELLGKAIVFVGLGEGIAIFGLIISLMLMNKI